MQFDMSDTWQRAITLVQSNFQLLAVIAGVFLLLPTLIMYVAVPELATMDTMIDTSGDDPEKLMAQLGEVYGSIAPWALLSTIVSFAGYAAMVTLMGANGVTVGDAIVRGFKAVPSLIAVLILFFISYLLAAFVVMIPIVLLATLLGMVSPVLAGVIGFFGGLAAVLVSLMLMARFSVTMPVMMLEGILNPITAMHRSWKLTGPRQWAILGFWALLFIVYTVLALILNAIIGLFASLASGTTAGLIMGLFTGLLGVFVGMIVSGIAVALHEQLTGDAPTKISETFE